MKQCDYCNKLTSNPRFCNRSCAAKKINAETPKRKRTKICSRCDEIIAHYQTSFCEKHLKERKEELILKCPNTKLEDYWNRSSIKDKHPSWKNNHIRNLNRYWNKSLLELPCANCGYNKHVELCHIKPISSFDGKSLLSEVNSIDNIIQLCPNCHWEFDNNFLTLEEIKK